MLNSCNVKREVSFVYKTDICNAVDDAEVVMKIYLFRV